MPANVLNNDLTIQWYGHATVLLTTPGGKRVMIDPFVQSNPSCSQALRDVGRLDLLLITHAHNDHMGDVFAVARSAQPKHIVAIHEIAAYLERKGVPNTVGMNRGGTFVAEGIKVTQTPAVHSSAFQDGETLITLGEACGYVVELENGYRVYHAGDTDLFGDMALIGERWRPDLALLPIGGHYTMGPEDAARAAGLLHVRRVVPIHYGTWPILAGTPEQLQAAGRASGLEVLALRPGETLS